MLTTTTIIDNFKHCRKKHDNKENGSLIISPLAPFPEYAIVLSPFKSAKNIVVYCRIQ